MWSMMRHVGQRNGRRQRCGGARCWMMWRRPACHVLSVLDKYWESRSGLGDGWTALHFVASPLKREAAAHCLGSYQLKGSRTAILLLMAALSLNRITNSKELIAVIVRRVSIGHSWLRVLGLLCGTSSAKSKSTTFQLKMQAKVSAKKEGARSSLGDLKRLAQSRMNSLAEATVSALFGLPTEFRAEKV